VCVFALVPSAGSRALAAGVSWTCRTHKEPWFRDSHTSVIDAFGAIYVIGGQDGGTGFTNDVWVSTDGGSRLDSAGWSGGPLGILGGTTGVLQGCHGVLRGSIGVLQRYRSGYKGVLRQYIGGTQGVLRGY
jgi:hypothetical protein